MRDFVLQALSDPDWKAEADRMMDEMFDSGVLPPRNRLTGGETGIFARAESGGVIGMVVVYQPEDTEMLWIDLLYVRPGFRNEGIGRALLHLAALHARSLKLPAIELGALYGNEPMIKLALKAGFGEAQVFMRMEV